MDATRFTGAWTWFGIDRKTWGYDADERSSTHPVAPLPEDVQDTESAFENFDGISYAKGASALRQLVAFLGEDAFLAGINDLLTPARSATRRSPTCSTPWTRARAGRARVGGRLAAHHRVDRLVVERTEGVTLVGHPGLRPHQVSVGLYDRPQPGEPGLVLRRVDALRLDAGTTTTVVDLGGGPAPAAVLIDDADLTWAKVRYDGARSPRSWRGCPRSTTR